MRWTAINLVISIIGGSVVACAFLPTLRLPVLLPKQIQHDNSRIILLQLQMQQAATGGDEEESTSDQYAYNDDIESAGSDSCDENDDDDVEMIRYRGRVAYDGSGFRGWQVQAKGRTGQGHLEEVLSTRFNRLVKIVGAGRTDAGVHARGQAFQFDLYPNETMSAEFEFCQSLQSSLNSMLKDDMRVYNLSPSPLPELVTLPNGSQRRHRWHVIYRAQKKKYTYRISLQPQSITTHPLHRYNRVHVDGNIDPEHLSRVLKYYEGTHDFRAFAGAIEANQRKDGIEHKDTVRTVYSVDLIDESEGRYRIEILLKGALYKMVRNMVGTALDVCKGRVKEDYMLQLLHQSKDDGDCAGAGNNEHEISFARKDNKCKPAPPEGLCLEKVYFEDDF